MASLQNTDSSFKDRAEDTDAADVDEPEKVSAPDAPIVWLRVLGLIVFVISIGLIIYGMLLQNSKGVKSIEDVTGIALTFKPRDEVRSFEFATLPNGLQVVTVQDSRALQKSFAVAVEAGSFDDPKSFPGLAHFAEHMEFLGTKKYSEPSGFDNFIASQSGFSNAFTAEEETVYFASVSQKAASEGLDRFADFFKAPLFSEQYADKEVHAIDSEHKKNIQDPARQALAVMYHIADRGSPASRFHTGNYQTLAKSSAPGSLKDPVKALNTFFKKHYCPGRMKVVTVGSESNTAQLDEIKEKFGGLKPLSSECQQARPKHDKPKPYPKERLQKWINVQGNLPRSFLWVQFPLPDVSSHYDSDPMAYIVYALQYKGENGLSRVLKDTLCLATDVRIVVDSSSAATELFIVVQLTNQGLDHEQLILDVIFSYIAVLNRNGVDLSLYNSLAAMEKLNWDWAGQKTPIDTSQQLAERLTRVNPYDLLWADSLILSTQRQDRELVQSLLSKISPENMNVAIVRHKQPAAEEEAFFKGQKVETLPFYGINFTVQDLDIVSQGSIAKWSQWVHGQVTATSIEKQISNTITKEQIKVVPDKVPVPKSPRAIQGIPASIGFEHVNADYLEYSTEMPVDTLLYGPIPESLQAPTDVACGKDPEIWYRSGWMRPSPKVKLSLGLNPLKLKDETELGPLQDLQLELYGRLFIEEIDPKLADLKATGMDYKIHVEQHGLKFEFEGFEANMHTLIDMVMTEFNKFNQNPGLTPEVRWTRVWHQLREDLTTYSELPLQYAINDRNLLLMKGSLHRTELADMLEKSLPTIEDCSASVSKLLLSRPLRLTALAMGNVAKEQATSLIGNFFKSIEYPKEVAKDEAGHDSDFGVERIMPVVNLQKPVEVRKMNPRVGDTNNIVVVSVMFGISTVESRVILGILGPMFKSMAYTKMRTEQQLGYVVNAGAVLLSNVHLMSCVVQGTKLDPDAMEAAVHHLTLDLMSSRLGDMKDEEFQTLKRSFRADLQQPPIKMKDEFEHFQGPVEQGGIGFDLQNEMLRYLDGPLVTKEAVKDQWQKLMYPSEGERNVVAVKYFAEEAAKAPRTLEQAKKTWADANVTKDSMLLLEREFKSVQVLDKVDSSERNKLAQQAGWLSTVQNFKLEKPTESAAEKPIEVPQQLKDLNKLRMEESEIFSGDAIAYQDEDLTSLLGKKRKRTIDSFSIVPTAESAWWTRSVGGFGSGSTMNGRTRKRLRTALRSTVLRPGHGSGAGSGPDHSSLH